MAEQKPTQRGGKAHVIAAVAGLTLSAAGLAWLSQEEGRRHVAYLDTAGVWTICDGHTGMARGGTPVKRGDRATDEMCDSMLREDIAVFEQAVRRCITVAITQNQFDALVVFAFNVGAKGVCSSTLMRKFNSGDCYGAARELSRWAKGGKGLVFRRARERKIFEADCR